MPHRDVIAIRKIIDEMSLGIEMLGDMSVDSFLEDEKLKRALGMNVKFRRRLTKRPEWQDTISGALFLSESKQILHLFYEDRILDFT